MKIGIQTWGSHGDYRPLAALAEGLQAAGHDVTLLCTIANSADEKYLDTKNGVKIRLIASPVYSDAQAEQIGRLIFNQRDPVKQLGLIMQHAFAPAEDAMFAAAQALCREADILLGHYFMHPLQIAAEHARKPYISVVLSASVVPSRYATPGGLPSLGQLGNRFFWWLANIGINRKVQPYPQRLRRQLNLPPPADVISSIWLPKPLTLLGVSPQLCERQADWPAHLHVCGFLDTPNLPVEGELPDTLAAFLQAGTAPVYMTFGSMTPNEPGAHRETLALFTFAAELAGCRAIIQSNIAQECGFRSSPQILFIPSSPHHAVFPHCLAVVHHGGAGTTQAATLAGKPSIVVAHLGEQLEWGKALQQRGIAGAPLERRKVSAHRIAAQIRQVQQSPAMQSRAQTIAQAMRLENGVGTAVTLIEQMFEREKSSTIAAIPA